MTQEDKEKWANFYFRLRKEYEEGKPFTYELDLASNQPKPRAAKFMIMITKFINIFKWGLREGYDNEDDRRDNYWSELCKAFKNDYEMGFVRDMFYEQPKNKIKKYFALLLHTKRIFAVLETIVNEMGYLFQNEEEKKKNFQEEIKNLDFLADGNYKVMGELISNYEEYVDKREEERKVKLLEEAEMKRKLAVQKKKEEEEIARLQKEKEEKEEKDRQEAIRKQEVDEKLRQRQIEEQKNQIISLDYIPQNYRGGLTNTNRQNINRDNSTNNLVLPTRLAPTEKLQNSERLFRERYKDELDVFSYSLKPEISENKEDCFECKEPLKKGIYFLGGNSNFCYYSGQWFCNNCISEERMSIPWKAIETFDLRGYSVSKKSHAELKTFYEKPIVEIHKDEPILKTNKQLLEFIVIKRQFHLMYDSVCNVELMDNIMKKTGNYCLKRYLFSMKNLYDIYNGQELIRLRKDYEILSKHFYKCPVCQKKKGYICQTCKDPVKIFPFEVKDTVGCSACRKLYHRKCLPSGICKCKDED